MSNFPLVLALALVAGLGGVVAGGRSALLSAILLSGSWTAALFAYRREWPRVLLLALVILIATSGWILGAHAVERAMAPSLRTLLDREFGGFAIDLADDSIITEPVIVEGRLREDAVAGAAGVTLRIDVSTIRIGTVTRSVAGGISVGVGGALQTTRLREWTAGRVLRAPAILRRPARYLNRASRIRNARSHAGHRVGRRRQERGARRGRRPAAFWEEAAARVRRCPGGHRAPRRLADPPASVSIAILIGDRGAGFGNRTAITGSRDLSRHRHFRRQHRDSRRADPRILAWLGVRGRLARR